MGPLFARRLAVVQRTPNVGYMDKYSRIDAPVIYQHPLARQPAAIILHFQLSPN
ncbi:MAG TPA: hypothetical protein VFG93_07120 [Gaiellaceae bacterium]|nr:hypothetical protein [Gaiellaceae bacterium]